MECLLLHRRLRRHRHFHCHHHLLQGHPRGLVLLNFLFPALVKQHRTAFSILHCWMPGVWLFACTLIHYTLTQYRNQMADTIKRGPKLPAQQSLWACQLRTLITFLGVRIRKSFSTSPRHHTQMHSRWHLVLSTGKARRLLLLTPVGIYIHCMMHKIRV